MSNEDKSMLINSLERLVESRRYSARVDAGLPIDELTNEVERKAKLKLVELIDSIKVD